MNVLASSVAGPENGLTGYSLPWPGAGKEGEEEGGGEGGVERGSGRCQT